MVSNWKSSLLNEVVEYRTGKLNSNAATPKGKYPFFTCSPQILSINNYAFDEDAILLAGNNANGIFHLHKYKGKFNAYQRTYVMKTIDTRKINNTYLYYFLTYKLNYLQSQSIGSATKYLTKKILDKIEVVYPEEQREMMYIGQLLDNLDQKIEMNNRIIANLEELSQVLFKRWFVDFEFPDENGNPYKSNGGHMIRTSLGLIPSSFNLGVIKDICELKYGKSLPKKKRVPGEYPVYGSGGITGYHNEYLVEGPGLVIGRKGSIGTMYIEAKNFYPIDTVFYVQSKLYSTNFLYQLFKRHDFTKANNDSAVPGLNRNFVYDTKTIIPSQDVIESFEAVLKPISTKINHLLIEVKTLKQLRDTLLPKLMSGEIELPDTLEVTEDAELLQRG